MGAVKWPVDIVTSPVRRADGALTTAAAGANVAGHVDGKKALPSSWEAGPRSRGPVAAAASDLSDASGSVRQRASLVLGVTGARTSAPSAHVVLGPYSRLQFF